MFKNYKFFLIVISLIFLILFGSKYKNNFFSFHFVDEEDNFVVGQYLLNGERLYENVFSHHQPIPYLISEGIQKVTEPNSIYLLISRHRFFIIVFSILWYILLIFRFGLPMFFVMLVFESVKYLLLGHLFLAESLASYPLLYLVGTTFNKNILKIEIFFLGLCFSFVFFTLATLWPILFFIGLYFIYNFRKDWIKIIYFLLGILLTFFIVAFKISILRYINDTILINQSYYIPYSKEPFINFNSLITPLKVILNFAINSDSNLLIKFISFLFLVNCFLLIRIKDFKLVLLSFVILWLSNFRYIQPGLEFYGGFHLIPWFLVITYLTAYLSFINYKEYKLFYKIGLSLFGLLILLFSFNIANKNIFTNRDVEKDIYINYSRQYDFGIAVNVMKSSDDKLFVASDEMLIYWPAKISHAQRFIYYYPWMANVPEFRKSISLMSENNLPTFLYCNSCSRYPEIDKWLGKYHRMTKQGDLTDLYVLPNKLNSLTSEQKTKIQFFNYDIK